MAETDRPTIHEMSDASGRSRFSALHSDQPRDVRHTRIDTEYEMDPEPRQTVVTFIDHSMCQCALTVYLKRAFVLYRETVTSLISNNYRTIS